MRTAVREAKTFESQLSDLQQLLWNEPDAVDCLVIAHHDPAMIRRLSDALPGNSVAVLPLRQADWEACLSEVLNLAEEYEIKNVIFAGHSEGAEPPSASAGIQRDANGRRLLARVHRIQQQLGASRRHLAQLIHRVAEVKSGQLCLQTGGARLDALFYIAASELFLRFDPATDSFVPLVERVK